MNLGSGGRESIQRWMSFAGLKMSAKKKFTEPITAGELLSQLQKDPNFVRMRAEQDAEMARNEVEFRTLEGPILADLRDAGLSVATIGNAAILEEYMPFSGTIVDVLLHWAPMAPSRIQECVIRLLAAAAEPFDGRVLTDLFDKTESTHLRWVIANTLEAARPRMIADWLRLRLENSPDDAALPLFRALDRVADRSTVLEVARRLLSMFPNEMVPTIARYGTSADIPALQRMVGRDEPRIDRKIAAAVRKITQREF